MRLIVFTADFSSVNWFSYLSFQFEVSMIICKLHNLKASILLFRFSHKKVRPILWLWPYLSSVESLSVSVLCTDKSALSFGKYPKSHPTSFYWTQFFIPLVILTLSSVITTSFQLSMILTSDCHPWNIYYSLQQSIHFCILFLKLIERRWTITLNIFSFRFLWRNIGFMNDFGNFRILKKWKGVFGRIVEKTRYIKKPLKQFSILWFTKNGSEFSMIASYNPDRKTKCYTIENRKMRWN